MHIYTSIREIFESVNAKTIHLKVYFHVNYLYFFFQPLQVLNLIQELSYKEVKVLFSLSLELTLSLFKIKLTTPLIIPPSPLHSLQ